MSVALSSIVRTRQKLFFLFILTLFFCPLFPPSGVQAAENRLLSVASPNVAGAGSSEEENIDSMGVHPINRWTISETGYTSTAADGLLNLTDVGDATADFYRLFRNLRDLDGTIELRFKLNVNTTVTNFDNAMEIILTNAAGTDFFKLSVFKLTDGGFATFNTLSYDTNEGTTTKSLSGDERFFDDLWYILRFDYDILESSLRIRNFFDNGSKVFDFHIFDISTARANIFETTDLAFRISLSTGTDKFKSEFLLDYVNAPFKEREWTQIDTPVDGNYLTDEWYIARANDDIDELSQYTLTVPYLDSVSGVLQVELPNRDHATFNTAGDKISVTFQVFAVDADDGDLHEAVSIRIETYEDFGGDISDLELELDNFHLLTLGAFTDTSADVVTCAFSIATLNDRSTITVQLQVDFDGIDDQRFYGEVDVSDVATDPSQEFLLKVTYNCDLEKNTDIMAGITSFNLVTKDIFSDIGGFLDDIIGDVQGAGTDIFSNIFRWLASVLTDAWELIIGTLQDALETGLSTIFGLLDTITTAISEIADGIWDAMGTALDFLFDAIDGIWLALIAILDDILAGLVLLAEDIADFVFALIEFLLDLLVTVLDDFWGIIIGIIFFAWDAVGLPDVLEIGNELLAYLIELVAWVLVTFIEVIELANQLSWIILVGWWVWAIPVQWARANGNPLGGLGNFVEVYFYDAIPWTVFGIHLYIPQGLVFTLWMILLLPETFILFAALGL